MKSLDKRVVFTGAHSTGKTSLLNYFRDKKYKVIEEQFSKSIEFLGFTDISEIDRQFFQEFVEFQQKANLYIHKEGIFDRSLVDDIAYRKYYGLGANDKLFDFCKEYKFDLVFLFPVWDKLVSDDYSFDELNVQENYLLDIYTKLGYSIIEVPRGTIQERYKFVKKKLNMSS